MRKNEYFKALPDLEVPEGFEEEASAILEEMCTILEKHSMGAAMTAIVETLRTGLRILKADEATWPLNKMMMQRVLLRILEIDLKDEDGERTN